MNRWFNGAMRFGLTTITLHWFSVVFVIGLFVSGLWMVDLNYYHAWYQKAPNLHRSFGLLLMFLTLPRLLLRLFWPYPASLLNHKHYERIASKLTQILLYLLLVSMFVSGYLITTAKGDRIDFFNWFSLPPTLQGVDNLEVIAGDIHKISAFSLVILATFHALAALKHHFIDRDETFKRIWFRR